MCDFYDGMLVRSFNYAEMHVFWNRPASASLNSHEFWKTYFEVTLRKHMPPGNETLLGRKIVSSL